MRIVLMAGIVLIVLGVALLVLDFLEYAKQKLTEGFGLIWGLLGVLLLAAGIVLVVAEQVTLVVWAVALLLVMVLAGFLFGVSRVVSVLMMKNQELAMQVSLLNQENESILQEFNALKERDNLVREKSGGIKEQGQDE